MFCNWNDFHYRTFCNLTAAVNICLAEQGKLRLREEGKISWHQIQLQNQWLRPEATQLLLRIKIPKRLKKELVETFNLNSQTAFEKFINEEIYKLIAPQDFELPKINLENLINKYNPQNIWVIYVGLLPDITSLPLTKTEKKIVEDFQKLKQNPIENEDFTIYKTFGGLNLETVIMYSSINEEVVRKYLDNLRKIKTEITGIDLQELGIKPSVKYQQCFDFILEQKLKNPELAKVQEIKLAKEFFGII